MFFQPQLALFLLIVGSAVYWAIPETRPRARLAWLAVFSALGVGMGAPQALLVALAITVIVVFWSYVFPLLAKLPDRWSINVPVLKKSVTIVPRYIAFTAAIGSVVAPMVSLDLEGVSDAAYTLGVSYVTIKAVSTIIDTYYERRRLSLARVTLLHLFLPIYSSGPIENLRRFADETFSVKFDFDYIFYGLRRILIGVFKSYFLGGVLLQAYVQTRFGGIAAAPGEFAAWEIVAFLLLNFLGVYINFSGYTDIAVGSARFFGIKVMENFNMPFLSSNIQEFWTRWHLSLARFINEYLYMRLTVLLRRPYLPLFIAFLAVGLWHKIAPGYLLWGIGHGGALVCYLYIRRAVRDREWYKFISKTGIYKALAWFLTMFYVSLLSFVANAESLDVAKQVLLAAFI